jgi:hypothetical protein
MAQGLVRSLSHSQHRVDLPDDVSHLICNKYNSNEGRDAVRLRGVGGRRVVDMLHNMKI